VTWVTSWTTGVRSPVGAGILSSPSRPDWLCPPPPSLPHNRYRGLFPRGSKPTTHIHIVPKLGIRGAITPLPIRLHGMVLGSQGQTNLTLPSSVLIILVNQRSAYEIGKWWMQTRRERHKPFGPYQRVKLDAQSYGWGPRRRGGIGTRRKRRSIGGKGSVEVKEENDVPFCVSPLCLCR
jgi:hypothetical protein